MTDVQTFVSEEQKADGGLRRDFRRLTRLYCMNGGHHLQILPDGTVQGQREDRDDHSKAAAHCAFRIQLTAVGIGVVIIQGTEAGRYLAMSDEGRLYGSVTVTDECYFVEKLEENHYNTYRSQKYLEENWYVALKKNGKPKLGPRTHIGQKAVFFLPRQLNE